MSSMPNDDKLKIAVVTGQHPFDVPGFHAVFRSYANMDCYIQHMEDFVSDAAGVRDEYDAVVFYNFHQATPGNETDWWDESLKGALERLGDTDQGIFILHHAVLAFPQWSVWQEIVGVDGTSFEYYIGETLRIDVPNAEHPITNGLSSWEMKDETYKMAEPGDDSEVLLTTNHPKSLKSIAWTRQYKNARVLCLQSGHDNETFVVPEFRTVVERGIEWCAGRL
ncbi:MAG: ThuA domain-containing protein [bacterium]|nr:ThuA domain-containing protein [bacterium]